MAFVGIISTSCVDFKFTNVTIISFTADAVVVTHCVTLSMSETIFLPLARSFSFFPIRKHGLRPPTYSSITVHFNYIMCEKQNKRDEDKKEKEAHIHC